MTKNSGGRALLALVALVLLEGCVAAHAHGNPVGVALAPSEVQGGAGGFPKPTADPFQGVQAASGLEEGARHPVGAALYLTQARELLVQLAQTPVTQRNAAPRRVLSWLLREVLEGGERVEYADLRWRAERFWPLVMVRPDGHLVAALTGAPIQRLGILQLEEGEWKVGRLVVGDFYFSHEGIFYPVNDALRRADGPPLAELGLGRDPLNAALDGAQDAVGEMAVALGQSVLHPIRSAEDLVQLPHTVASLIASSPEYFARYGDMSREEQIREAARLSTHLMMLLGGGKGVVGATGRMGGWGAEVPVLSLSARGELVLGGAMTSALGADVGALSILYMAGRGQGKAGGGNGKAGTAHQTASKQGPGRWTYKKPTTESEQALNYQEQVTGQPAWRVYMVGEVEFDGFNGKELLEAKGVSYKKFITKNGTIQPWFKLGEGFNGLKQQAERQSKLAQALNLPLVWHVAEVEFANFLRELFAKERWTNIDVRHTPSTW